MRIRQSDASMFEVGRNLAVTPGKVIYQNEIMQLIQYAPSTEKVLKTPLLIVPPWINKFYVLDLTPEKSFIKWCVDRGLTVFVVSWVNPDAKLAKKSFEQYMREGVLADGQGGAARLKRGMVERVLAGCAAERGNDLDSLLALLRRFAVEAAREEARSFCDDLVAESPAVWQVPADIDTRLVA